MKREIKKIKVKIENIELNIGGYQGQNLLELLQENNISVPAICHGNGTCGKCKVKVLSGSLPITEADKKSLSKEELEQGIRLACKANLETISIEILGKPEHDIMVEAVPVKEKVHDNMMMHKEEESSFFIAIDIGTTTIAMARVNSETGEVCDTYTTLNHQRKYGADVISRIKAANDGKNEELKKLIEEDLWQGICRLTKAENKENADEIRSQNEAIVMEPEKKTGDISRIVIVGNTTMIHLLMGFSCHSLGKYPFVSEHLGKIECVLKDVITIKKEKNILGNIPVTILPGISAFVGGDIVADILVCPGFETEEICLLIDLGTNGEMVLGNKDRLLAASTAAGPAFEGGNITCGTASVPGSICQVKIQNQRAVVKTIDNSMPPIGICGTGLVSIVAQLLKNKLVDGQGNLRYPYSEKGFLLWSQGNGESVKIYQKDIREFQMAKSAIRAGVEILMQEYGCQVKDIQQIYLAGGFGTNLLAVDAIATGILPEEWKDKIIPIGNGALQGAVQVGRKGFKVREQGEHSGIMWRQEIMVESDEKKHNYGLSRIKNIINSSENISLAEHDSFSKMYLKYMEF